MTPRLEIFGSGFFARPADQVAPDLLGAIVVSVRGKTIVSGRIVETEAYLGRDDPASHGYLLRRTRRNAALFGPPGSWYVYLSYGIHWCCNLVCGAEGGGAAVLLRALEPVDGLSLMRRRRGVKLDQDLCSGPGRLCEALGVTRAQDGRMMTEAGLRVYDATPAGPAAVLVTPRIGITKAADWPLRFLIADCPWVSGVRKNLGAGTRAKRGPAPRVAR